MKYILIIMLLFMGGTLKAQFTGTDSLRNYNIRFITNNPATAFTNLRLHTLLRGIIDWVDTARAGTGGGGAVGVDTLWALNDSTVRYRKNGVFRNFILKGVYDLRRKVDTVYKVNDTTIGFTINQQARTIIIPGRNYVDSIYRKNGQDSIYYRKAGIEYAIKDSSGTNLTLTNVGTGFRWVTTPNGSIKSVIFGYGLNGDSTSTANTITVQADTSELVTPSDLNDAIAGVTVQTEQSVTGNGSSGSKIKLVNDEATPGNNKVYGTNGSGTKGYQTAAVLNLSSPANGQILIYQDGEWVNTDYTPFNTETQITFRVALDPVLAAGDSVYQDDELIGKNVKVYREGERMYLDTVYGIEVDTSTGTIIFHPYLSSAEKIIIETANYTTTNPSSTLEDLTFPTAVSLTNTGTTWSATSSASFYDGYGLSNKKLASGEDGYIRARYTTTDGSAAIIAFNTSNTNQQYADNPASPSVYNYEAGAFLASGTLYYLDNNAAAASTGHTLSVGDYWRIIRTGSTLKLQTSPDASTWTDRHTYTFSSSADLFINCNIDANTGANKLFEPKGFNVE